MATVGGMDGSPQLLTNIQFAEAKKKGYDREQVDNFLRELSVKIGELQDMLRQATQRAEAAEQRASEAAKGRNAAESDVEALRDELSQLHGELELARSTVAAPAPAGDGGLESATGVLAMAQKTADAAIAEAEAKASDTLADAQSRAAMVVMEAEQDASRLKREAIDEADSLRASRVSRMEAEVDKLSAQRDGLQKDIDALEAHVEQHRSALRQHATAITQLLDSPGAFSLPSRPELVGEAPDLTRRRTGPAAEERATQVSNLLEPPAAESTDRADAGDDSGAEGSSSDDVGDLAVDDGTAAPAAEVVTGEQPIVDEPAADSSGIDEVALGVSQPTGAEADAGDARDGDEVFAPAPVQRSVQPLPEEGGQQAVQHSLIDLTAAKLFDDNPGEPTQAFDVLADPAPEDAGEGEADRNIVSTGSAPSSPLGEPDAEADEAMRAFFEQDFQQPGETSAEKRGFLRRK